MGAYRAAVVTAAGQNIIAQALADVKAVEFTSAKTSSYLYPSGTNITGLTGLQDVEQSVIPFAAQVMNGNVVQVSVRFDNDEITQQYPINTIGLYAKVKDGEEVLFSVIQAIIPDEMPVHSDVSPSAFIYNIQHTVQNAAQITIVVNPAGTATVQDIYGLTYPEFEDYSAEGAEAPDARTAIEEIKSKKSIFGIMSNIKAALKGLVTLGEMKELLVNNGLCNIPGQYFLDAAFGKNLQDQVTDVNNNFYKFVGGISIPQGADLYSDTYKVPGNYYCSQDSTARTLKNCPIRHAFTMKVESSTGVASVFYPCQTIRGFNSGELFYRIFNGDTNSWMDDISYVKRNDMRPKELMPIGSYPVNSEIILNSDVTAFNKLIFLFGSPNSEDQGYITQEVYPWGFNSNELGVKQPYIGMSVLGEKVVFKWLSNTKIKYIVGGPTLRRIFGVRQA